MPVVEDAESAVRVEGMDQPLLETGHGDGSVADSRKLQAGVLRVEVLVKADFSTSGGLDGNFGEVRVADEGSKFANDPLVLGIGMIKERDRRGTYETHLCILVRVSHRTPPPHSQYVCLFVK